MGEVKDDSLADMHNSMTEAWNLAEWAPRLVWSGADEKRHLQIGAMPPFRSPHARFIPDNAFIHRSVEQRLQGFASYRPANLPVSRTFVDDTPFSRG